MRSQNCYCWLNPSEPAMSVASRRAGSRDEHAVSMHSDTAMRPVFIQSRVGISINVDLRL